MHAPISKSETQRLQARLRERATEVHTLEARIAQLRTELAATMLPYRGHTSHLRPDGTLVIVQHSGVVYEMVTRDEYSDTATTFGKREFRKLPSVPGSPAARIDAVTPPCVGEQMERAS